MSDLSHIEKKTLENIFEMESGYVLDFSNKTFQSFIFENTNLNIESGKYDNLGSSKANRLREFWRKESNSVVGNLIEGLLDYWYGTMKLKGDKITRLEQDIAGECRQIASRLKKNDIYYDIDVIQFDLNDQTFYKLAKEIRTKLEVDQPELVLDRLHTYTISYLRNLCKKHNVPLDNNKKLIAIFTIYKKHLIDNNLLKSDTSAKLLKLSNQMLVDFNAIRNNESLAHDNILLSYNDSKYIVSNVLNFLIYIRDIEKQNIVL